ncbi:MAG: hypothetical protein QME75_12375 [Deltaproteobacteria bacterium]|nr:hypothetical protein [Deltaproteobacteria bacterium]
MSLTTDITGGLFGPTEEEEKLLRQLAVQNARLEKLAEMQEAERQAALPVKRLGRAGYYGAEGRAGGSSREVQHLGLAALQGRELGEETSYGGQRPLSPEEAAGARRAGLALGAGGEPIEVIRRTTATYAGPRAGSEEYATPGQARQAFRRDLGAGQFEPSGTGLARLKAKSASPLDPAKYFEALILNRYGVENPETKERALPQYARDFLLENLPSIKTPEDAVRLLREAAPRLEEGKRLEALGTQPARDRMYRNYLTARQMGLAPDMPNAAEVLLQGRITPENAKVYEQWLNWQPPKQERGPAGGKVEGEPRPSGFWGTAARGAISGLEGLRHLGHQIAYESTPLSWREGMEKPRWRSLEEIAEAERRRSREEEKRLAGNW